MSEREELSRQVPSTTELFTEDSSIKCESQNLIPLAQTSKFDDTSDDRDSDNECGYEIGDPIDDNALTKRQIDSAFGFHNRGDKSFTEEFDLPSSILLDVTSDPGAAMPIIVLLIGDGISAKLPCKPVAGIHLHEVPSVNFLLKII